MRNYSIIRTGTKETGTSPGKARKVKPQPHWDHGRARAQQTEAKPVGSRTRGKLKGRRIQ